MDADPGKEGAVAVLGQHRLDELERRVADHARRVLFRAVARAPGAGGGRVRRAFVDP